MIKIRCIIFDFGGVVTEERIEDVFEEANKRVGKKVFVRRKGLHTLSAKGKISAANHYRVLGKKTGVHAKLLEKAFVAGYLKILRPNKDVLEVTKHLKLNGYEVAMISNMNKMSKKINKKRNIFSSFYPAILSCDVGYIKPQKKIFKIALEKIGSRPPECVFIDDRKEFLTTPKRMGMKVIRFRNAQQLKRDLRKIGVKI